ncbi:MAG TPA: hypothetical protein VGO11_25570 [Chthoniobacteraceae bacterium]|jgi:hypothetical protein|nr:hypothetical protein [Chthoniobacteraceae bacterium]
MDLPLQTRRRFLQQSLALSAACATPAYLTPIAARADESPIQLGGRRELLVDDFLIERLDGVALTPHQPEAREVVLTCDAPWEGNTSGYFTVFADEGRFRMYYRGWHFDPATKKETHAATTCLAESRDGLVFTKPKLGRFEYEGSKENNIVHMGDAATHNFTPFKDQNPAANPNARYKALGGVGQIVDGKSKMALRAYGSPDGIHWSPLAEEGVITAGAFDSQNLAFWDAERGEYRAYWRIFANKVRAIRTATSKDFLHWENQADLTYGDAPAEHLYTNAVRPYFRAPHLFLGFPTRYQPKNSQVEPVFMTSRDGVRFRRWSDALIPITAPQDRDGNRSNYMTNGLLPLPGQDRELSVYATEAYYAGPGGRVRRFVYRMDGFVSARAEAHGTLLTKPLTFAGAELRLNVASRGVTRAELQDAAGRPIAGFALADCAPIQGDFVDQVVAWKGGTLAPLSGQAVRLRVELQDADLYAFQFRNR